MPEPTSGAVHPDLRTGEPSPWLRRILRGLLGQERRFWVLVVGVGLISGLGAVALLAVLRFTQHLFWQSNTEHFLEGALASPGWRRFLVPVLGGALVTWVSLVVG